MFHIAWLKQFYFELLQHQVIEYKYFLPICI